MEGDDEAFRLAIKIDEKAIEQQALWAGIKPGMRVADLGCGPGRITSILHKLVQPGGSVVGVDGSQERIQYAREKYGQEGVSFATRNLSEPLSDLGEFDFIWVRFVLEYYLSSSFEMVGNFAKCLKPGGILCLIDLDHNQTNRYGAPDRLERTIKHVVKELGEKFNFDPYLGRKLYAYLYDLGFTDIDVDIIVYNLIYGDISEVDVYNLMKKVEVIPQKMNLSFEEYPGGYEEFRAEAEAFFSDPRRFTYTPMILCRGRKPGVPPKGA